MTCFDIRLSEFWQVESPCRSWCISDVGYRYEVIQLLVKFTLSSAAILDFEKFHIEASQCLGGSKVKLELKFYGNRRTGFEVIQVFVNLKIAASPSFQLETEMLITFEWYGRSSPNLVCSIITAAATRQYAQKL